MMGVLIAVPDDIRCLAVMNERRCIRQEGHDEPHHDAYRPDYLSLEWEDKWPRSAMKMLRPGWRG